MPRHFGAIQSCPAIQICSAMEGSSGDKRSTGDAIYGAVQNISLPGADQDDVGNDDAYFDAKYYRREYYRIGRIAGIDR